MTSAYQPSNKIVISALSVNEARPCTIVFENLPSSGNVLVSAKRYDILNANDTGTDVSANVTINGNAVTLSTPWLDAEDPLEGEYGVQIIAASGDSTIKQEKNYMYVIVWTGYLAKSSSRVGEAEVGEAQIGN